MNPKVSVILAVYNTEEYLTQCVTSIQTQTLEDIEIICVNDGSTDESAEIIESLAKDDSRIILMNQKNKGAGAARNLGLSMAKGDYLSFLDSDDFFESTMLEKSYDTAKSASAQLVCYRSNRYYERYRRYEHTPWTLKRNQMPMKEVFSAKEIRPNIYTSMHGWAWDKLFEHEYIKKHKLKFQEIKIHNDMYFVYSALVAAERITVLDDIFAHQRKRTGSLSSEDVKSTSLECTKEALLATYKWLRKSGNISIYERDFINYVCSLLFYHMSTTHGVHRELLYDYLQKEWLNLFGVFDKDQIYFYSSEEYIKCQMIKHLPYKAYLEFESICKIK